MRKSVGMTMSSDEDPELVEGDWVALSLREKLRKIIQIQPYSKPTQVDW
jgi:hypothetical protein